MILREGIHKDIPFADYLADPAAEPSLNHSTMHVILTRSMSHAWTQHPRLNPAHQSEDETKFDLGHCAHEVLLLGESRVRVIVATDWRTKAAKEDREAALEAGEIPILAPAYAHVMKMTEVARRYIDQTPLAGIFGDGDPEVTMIASKDGVTYRTRVDWLSSWAMIDYKTTGGSADPAGWCRAHLEKEGNDLQAALYPMVHQILTGDKPLPFYFLVQEASPPYACSLVALTPEMEDLALRKVHRATQMWRDCRESGVWPAYYTGVYYAEAQPWSETNFENRVFDMDGAARLGEYVP